MPQFYLPPEGQEDNKFHLKGPEAFHISKVLRYREGQPLVLFDGKGTRYDAVIGRIHPDGSVSGAITKVLREGRAHGGRVALWQGLLKSSHWDWLVEKAVELGAAEIHPVLTPRTVVLLREESRARAKQERWAKLALAAAKQCGRADVPTVAEPVEFRDAIKTACAAPGSLTLLAWEGMGGATARESLRETIAAAQGEGKPPAVNIFVGPEGGFSEEEVELAESLGAVVFGLGPITLRAETAALAAISVMRYEFGRL